MKAIFNGQVIAESDKTIVVEGNHYFPASSVKKEYLGDVEKHAYTCSWKGVADYYDVVVGDKVAKGAAWVYPDPKEEAEEIAGLFAFWKGVEIVD